MSVEDGRLAFLLVRSAWGRAEVAASLRLELPAAPEEEPAFLQQVGTFLLSSRIPPGGRVVLGVPRQEFLLRRIETPPVKAQSLPELVEFEIERHLPGKREEFLCGWRVEGRAAGGGHAILFGAARRSGVDRIVALLRRANVSPASIQPETLALAALGARTLDGDREALLIQIGTADFSADLVRGGRLDLSRTFAIEDSRWRESLLHPAASAEGAVELRQAAALALGETIASRIKQPLFLEGLPGGRVPEIRLAGHGINRSALIEKLQNELRVPVRILNPWLQVRWGTPPADLAPFLPALALALEGLSGSRAGLELAEEQQEALHRAPRLRLTAALAVLLGVAVVGLLAGFALRQQRQLTRVESEIKSLKVKMAAVDVVNRRVQEQRARLRYLRETIRKHPSQAEMLRELTALVPPDSYLSEYTFREGQVEVTGFSPSASRLLPLLEESALFKGVEFSAPIVAQGGGGLERFRIRMRLEQAGG